MGVNPMILRQGRAFAFLLSPSVHPAVPRRPYRASGFRSWADSGHSLLSTATARLLQIAVVRAGMSEIRDVVWGSLRYLSRRAWIGQTYPQPRGQCFLELLTSQRQRSFPGALQA